MEDFEEKLNAILSSPESMQQVAQLAQMLSSQSQDSSPEPEKAQPEPSASSIPDFSSLLGEMDISTISRFLPLLQAFNSPAASNERTQLLYALKPFLKQEKQDKIDHALRLARLFHAGKQLFKGFGDQHV